jgi:hypothetical protein
MAPQDVWFAWLKKLTDGVLRIAGALERGNELREADVAGSLAQPPEPGERCPYDFHVSVAEFDDAGNCRGCGESHEHENHVGVLICKELDGAALEHFQSKPAEPAPAALKP